MLKIIPLGGLGEIGLNMMVFETANGILIVDAGLMFPEDHMLGVDFAIPDMTYVRQKKSMVGGVILTHGHEDHIGALPYLLREIDAPIFGTPFTLGLAAHKLEAHGMLAGVDLRPTAPGQRLRIGDFEAEFIRVAHSVVDGVGLALRTPAGLVIHTGDFKIGPSAPEGLATDIGRFACCATEGVLALLSDSTNVEKEGYTLSGRQIAESMDKIAADSSGRIIVALFASNIARIQQIINIARARGRKVAVNGRSIENSVGIARKLNYLEFPPETEIPIADVRHHADDKIVLITTGSQGEPMSVLARMAAGTHRQIKIRPGDTVVLSSKFIPGNERAIGKIINNLYRLGANVIYEKISNVHVSGHAFREELRMMLRLTQPRYFIPIHGEYRHLVLHARLAEQEGIRAENILLVENGQVVRFDPNGGQVTDPVPTGRVLVDGKGIGDVGRSVLKERKILSEDGLVVVNMAFDEETGIILYGPDLVSRGFVFETQSGHLLEDAKCVILEIVDEIAPETPQRVALIRTKVQKALKQYFFFAIKRRPVILPFIQEI